MSEPLLEVAGLTKRFASGIVAAQDVGFRLEAGETLALAGPSGSGKSTVARLLLRLLRADAGSVRFAGADWLALPGEDLRRRRRDIQMVFQDPNAAFNPRSTVAAAIGDPLRIHGIGRNGDRPALVARALEAVGLPADLAKRAIHEVSGGQRQRIALARALATKPRLVILDEALSAIDASLRLDMLELLLELQRRDGVAYLFISHDLALVRAVAHRVAIMDAGKIVETGDARPVIDHPQSDIAKALVAATPRLLGQGETHG